MRVSNRLSGKQKVSELIFWYTCRTAYLLKTPPSNEAFKHSGGDRRRWTSATVTLYFEVELSRDRRPGTVQKMSTGQGPWAKSGRFSALFLYRNPNWDHRQDDKYSVD